MNVVGVASHIIQKKRLALPKAVIEGEGRRGANQVRCRAPQSHFRVEGREGREGIRYFRLRSRVIGYF